MDETRIFRNLVTNQHMKDFDYRRTKYSFQTVWYRSAYSYCFCGCGFQHEFVDYVSESGYINEEIYEKILLCVLAGNCPHVYEASPEYIRETGVYGLHIAAVAGNYEALKGSLDPKNNITGTLFKLNAYQVVLIKIPALASKFNSETRLLLKGLKIVEAKNLKSVNPETIRIRFEEKSAIDCARKGNISVLELENTMNFSKTDFINTLQIAFKYDLGELQELLKHTWNKIGGIENMLEECCTLAIVYDKPEFLHFLLHRVSQLSRMHCKTDTGNYLCKICDVLRRRNCKQVLLIKQNYLSGGTYIKLDALNIDSAGVVKSLVNSLFTYGMRQELMAILRLIPNISRILDHIEGDRGSILHTYNADSLDVLAYHVPWISKTDNNSTNMCDPNLLKMILDLNVDINREMDGRPPLTDLLYLKWSCHNTLFRDAEELYIFENPDLDLHKTALLHALRVDEVLYQMDTNVMPIAFGGRRIYIMDGKEHGLQGHDGSDMDMNFMVPLLIECGFPVVTDFHEAFEKTKDFLNPAEQMYIYQCLQTPRSLLLISRDTLRRHYRGRRIHRFVEMINIPKTVKDFILLKPLLKCVPKHLLH